MTFVLLGLPAIPKPTEEAREAEAKLDAQLKEMVKGIMLFYAFLIQQVTGWILFLGREGSFVLSQ